MKIERLSCPSCGASLPEDFVPNQKFECPNCASTLILSGFEINDTIVCPTCNVFNSDDKRHCSNCGEALRTQCVMCHASNRYDVTFCYNCGVHLTRARAQRQAALDEKQRQIKERAEAFKVKAERQQKEKLTRLLAALDEPENHEYALFQLRQIGPDAIQPLIDTLLNDDDVDARYGSARALGQICQIQKVSQLVKARAAKALITALEDSEPAVRYWSAHALGRFSGPIAVEPIGKLLTDAHKGVREQAAKSLQSLGGERAQEILEENNSRGFFSWLKGH